MAEKKIFKIEIKDMTEEEQKQFFKDFIKKIKKDSTSLTDEYVWNGVDYFTEKRDDLIERLVKKIKCNEKEELIQSMLKIVLKTTNQLKMMQDALIIYRVTKANKEK